jgi:AcrR family transcriptional regulator
MSPSRSASAPGETQIVPGSEAWEPHLRRDAALNRQRVLAAAEQIFAARGLDASIDAVIDAAGVGTGTFYRRFPNKEALIDALMVEVTDRFLALGRQALDDHTEDGTALERFLFMAGEHIERYEVLAQRLWSRGSLATVGTERIDSISKVLSDLVASARRHDRVTEDVTAADVRDTLRAVTGIVHANVSAGDGDWRRHVRLVVAGMRSM